MKGKYMEPWDIMRQKQQLIKEMISKRIQMEQALERSDYESYKVLLSVCRNISKGINDLEQQYQDAIDKEMRGWK